MTNLFEQEPITNDDDEWNEDEGWDETDEEPAGYLVDPEGELLLQYGTETVSVRGNEVPEGVTVGDLFTTHSETLMLSRPISQLNIRCGGKFVQQTITPELGTLYVATVSVDSKGNI